MATNTPMDVVQPVVLENKSSHSLEKPKTLELSIQFGR